MERIQQQLAMMQQQQQQAMEFLQKWQSRKRAPGEYMFEYADVVRLTWERLASGEDAEAMMQQAMIQQALSLPTHPSLIELERMEQQLAMMQQQQAMAMVQLQQQLQQQLAMMQHRQQAMAMMQQQQQAMMQQSAMTLWREQQQHSLARAVELLSCEAVFQESSAPAAGPQVGSIVTIISRVMGAPADRTPLHFSVGERLEIAQVMHWQNAWYATCTRYTTLWFPLSSTDWRDGGLQLGAEPLPLSPMIQHAAAAGHDATATAATLARPGSNEQASWAAVAARRPAQIPELDQEGRGALERGRAVRLAVQLRAQGPPRQGRQPEVRRHGGGQGQPPELLPGARTIPEPDEWVAAARRRRAAAGRDAPRVGGVPWERRREDRQPAPAWRVAARLCAAGQVQGPHGRGHGGPTEAEPVHQSGGAQAARGAQEVGRGARECCPGPRCAALRVHDTRCVPPPKSLGHHCAAVRRGSRHLLPTPLQRV